jgi:hypothetical protein
MDLEVHLRLDTQFPPTSAESVRAVDLLVRVGQEFRCTKKMPRLRLDWLGGEFPAYLHLGLDNSISGKPSERKGLNLCGPRLGVKGPGKSQGTECTRIV